MPGVFTRRGDDGTTGLITGTRVSKSDPMIRAIGSVDELNSFIGLAITEIEDGLIETIFTRVQSELFALGADLGATGTGTLKSISRINATMVSRIEREIEGIEAKLPEQRSFILPGGCRSAALLHVARSVCRRAEREIVAVSSINGFNKEILRYINRLGDLLHVAARYMNVSSGKEERAPVYE